MMRAYLGGALAAICLFAPALPAQDEDWASAVERANTHRRYPLRLAIAKKIARAGAEAIPAVREFAKDRGADALQLTLVDAIATHGDASEATTWLLSDWAKDASFYWRSHALMGLARRGHEASRELFVRGMADPSHLFRIEAARGLLALGERDAALAGLEDEDPRARLGVALVFLEAGDDAGLAEAGRALAWSASFLDDPWGPRSARRAATAVLAYAQARGVEGDFGYRADPEAGFAAMRAWISDRLPDVDLAVPAPMSIEAIGGVEIRSCRHGDLFVRWDDAGSLWFGLENPERVVLPETAWAELRAAAAPAERREGRVVCDFLRVQDRKLALDSKCAPGSLPVAWSTWFARFADAVAEVGEAEIADAMRSRLVQFSGDR